MKILIFSTVFYPMRGGIENLTLNLCKEFISKGHEVKVIAYQKQTGHLEGIDVFYTPNPLQVTKMFLWCDVYYMPNISLKGIWPLLMNPRKNWVISQNDFSLTNSTNILSFIKLLLIKFSSKNISVSKSIASSLKTSSEVIYNCYDDAVFTQQNLETRLNDFVFIGRLVTQKGCDTLIKACANLRKPFSLTIVGDGPEMENLKALVNKLQITKEVTFAGTKSSNEIVEILNQHTTLVIPSNGKEGFGIVALEGLACGCRVIAANSGGLAEAVGNFGRLFQSENVLQLNQLLQDAIQNVNQPQYTQNELAEYLSNYNKQAVAQKYLSIFDKAA